MSMSRKRERARGFRVGEKARKRRSEFHEKVERGMGREGWRRRRTAYGKREGEE